MNGFFSGAGLRRLRDDLEGAVSSSRHRADGVLHSTAFTGDVYMAASGVMPVNAALAVLDGDHRRASRELASRFQPPYSSTPSAGWPDG